MSDELELLGRMHLDAIRNGDWERAAALAKAIESHMPTTHAESGETHDHR